MGLDERSRHELFIRLEEVLGPGEATTLMEMLPPVGWADVATRRDLDQKIDVLAATLRAEFRAELNEQTRTLIHAMLLALTSAVLAVGGLAFAAARLA
ncbi:MAG TPA: hypothetical protein VF972_07205 [Actinomycetota bacterium]